MDSGLNPADPTLVAAFRSALLHQGLIVLLIAVFLGLLWASARVWRSGSVQAVRVSGAREPRARTLLRAGFGLLWVLDGILQTQPKMAGGLAGQVIEPTAASSPTWVQHLISWGGAVWSYHPVTAAAATVWIQAGIGAWLLVAARGTWSRLAGLAAVAWGLVVWVFGESFGGIFAPGLSWLTGAPGAVALYVVAGALVALPEGAWRSPRAGRLLLAGIGVFFVGMAVLQAWPGRGFWAGRIGGQPGTLAGMVQDMSGTPQPHVLAALVGDFGSFAASNGLAVNLVVVIVLGALGAAFLTGRPRLVRYAVWAGLVFCLADWVLVQDLGVLGGLGTDPNSMIGWVLLFWAGWLALTPETAVAGKAAGAAEVARGWRQRLAPGAAGAAVVSASAWSVAAVAALAVVAVGAVPMAAAAASRTADPILAQAIAGDTAPLDVTAPGFSLTDQNGQPVSLAGLRGKVVLLTFLDPVCTTDCPIIGAEIKQAGVMLGAAAKDVELVAVVANPTYRSTVFTQAFDREEGLTTVPNWRYLTGSLSQLSQVWRHYGITVQNLPAGAMSAHSDLAVVIDRTGQIREEINADPGPGTASTQSSFSVLLSQYARQALASS